MLDNAPRNRKKNKRLKHCLLAMTLSAEAPGTIMVATLVLPDSHYHRYYLTGVITSVGA